MYDKAELAFVPYEFDHYPVTSASFGLIRDIQLLEHAGVILVATPGELPQIAFTEGAN